LTLQLVIDPLLCAALDAADRGQRDALDGLGGLPAGDEAFRRAARWAVTARLKLTNPAGLEPPTVQDVAPLVGESAQARSAGALACSAAAMGSVLDLDIPALRLWNQLGAELVGTQPHGLAACSLRLGQAWEDVMEGGAGAEIEARLDVVRAEAAEMRAAVLVVDTTVLRALTSLNAGDLGQAIDRARRASRMARTEAIPRAEFLAHLVLARVRRISGKPHLAARIASSLLEFAAAAWHPWILWELGLAGGEPPVSVNLAPAWPLLGEVREVLAAAEAGDRPRFDVALARAMDRTSNCAWLGADLRALSHLVDPTLPLPALDPRVLPWVRGETPETPYGLHGLCASPATVDPEEAAVAFVIAGPGQTPRRTLLQGLELVTGEGVRVAQMRRKSGRLDTAAAALALAGPEGLESTEFFKAVYGFAYSPELHRGVIKTLVHRLRSRLEDLARVHSEGGRLVLEPVTSLILPDPRCAAALNDRVLWLLSTHRGLSARDAAQRLNLPLRTVQTALHELVEDGSCESQRSGRSVSYEVEDTTFSEPTQILRRRGKLADDE
jgi:hypothetical protein